MTFFAKHKTIRSFFDFQELYSLTTSAEYADFCLLLRGIQKKVCTFAEVECHQLI
jgi:hypothetical protein